MLEDAAKRPDVDGARVGHVQQQLWGFEPGGAAVTAPVALHKLLKFNGVVEVSDLDAASLKPEYVGRLDVSVDNAHVLVKVLESKGHLPQHALDLRRGQRDAPVIMLGQFLQIMPGFLHFYEDPEVFDVRVELGDVSQIVGVMDFLGTGDVGVVEPTQEHDFLNRMMTKHAWVLSIWLHLLEGDDCGPALATVASEPFFLEHIVDQALTVLGLKFCESQPLAVGLALFCLLSEGGVLFRL